MEQSISVLKDIKMKIVIFITIDKQFIAMNSPILSSPTSLMYRCPCPVQTSEADPSAVIDFYCTDSSVQEVQEVGM